MKDLVIVYLLPIGIIMSFICPCNYFAPGELISTFFVYVSYIPGTMSSVATSSCAIWGSTCCALCVRLRRAKKVSGFSLLCCLVSSSSLVSSHHQMFTAYLWWAPNNTLSTYSMSIPLACVYMYILNL